MRNEQFGSVALIALNHILEPDQGKLSRVTFRSGNETVFVDLNNYTLQILRKGQAVYYVDLEQCTASSELLDRIIQITDKTWITPSLLGLTVKALSACLHPQATSCSFGSDRTINQADIRKAVNSGMHEAVLCADDYSRQGIELEWR